MAEKVENYFYIEAISATLRTHFPGIDQPRTQALSSGKERPWSELVT